MNDKLHSVQEAVYASVGRPHFEIPCTHRLMHDENGCPFGEHLRPIRLSDVLLALPTIHSKTRQLNAAASSIVLKWSLPTDDLTLQSPETIDFIHQLLTK